MRLSRRDRRELADLINSIAVFTALGSDHDPRGVERPARDIGYAWSKKAEAKVRLADEFGIELPGLDLARIRVNADRARFEGGLGHVRF